ncbi:methylmalonyl-CoA epimerase [Halovenus sp. HT40]|uniref:methylmalonyl-CoA epimerase n=1 Tax=Halovenus sp. HT40 TaxID=3126691 RepID=UPI00300F4C82
MRVDHAGIATDNAESMVERYTALFDCSVAHEETFDGMEIHFLDLGNCYFEVIEPLEDGAIASYLDRNGPGIHHLAIETDDIEASLETARELDIDLIDEQPRAGAWGHDVAFLHPGSTGGVLIEFVEH